MKTKVLPVNFNDDLEQVMKDEDCCAIGIDEMSITYIQPADTCSDPDDVQMLTITSQCVEACGREVAINEEGHYFNIKIPEGSHWSVDDGKELKALIDDFKKRLYMVNEFNSEQHEKE